MADYWWQASKSTYSTLSGDLPASGSLQGKGATSRGGGATSQEGRKQEARGIDLLSLPNLSDSEIDTMSTRACGEACFVAGTGRKIC